MKRNQTILFALLATTLLAMGGCKKEPEKQEVIENGIVSLAPSTTELLYALDLEQQLVGATTACDYPEAAKSLPRVGGFMNINREAILSSGAKWVIGVKGGLPDTEVNKLENAGLNVLLLNSDTIADTMEAITTLGKALKIETKATAFRTALETSLRQPPSTKIGKTPTAIMVISAKPLIVAGPKTFVGELLELAGLKNAVPAGAVDYPAWDKEALLKANPDWIIFAMMKGDDPAKDQGPWSSLPAAAEGRTRFIHPDILLRPGPRMVEGVQQLREAISNVGGTQE